MGYAGTVRVRGFSYDGTGFTSIKVGQNSATFSSAINNAGDIAGGTGSIYSTKGFEGREGHFKIIGPPGSFVYTYGTGINNLGDIVGWTDYDGFLYSAGISETIRFPGSDLTETLGINDKRVIVGWYEMSGSVLGFMFFNGHYTSFSYPGASGTLPRGINASGQIVGEYTIDFNKYHGFIATPIGSANFSGPDSAVESKTASELEF